MDILFLLVPLSVVLALAIMGLLAWAVWSGQFDDVDSEGERIMHDVAATPAEAGEKDEKLKAKQPFMRPHEASSSVRAEPVEACPELNDRQRLQQALSTSLDTGQGARSR